jgi:biofilm protein TabA
MIHDKLKNWTTYFSSEAWQCVFGYLAGLTEESPDVENVRLKGDKIYASVMSYQTCDVDESVLETHDQHVDIQMSLKGSEAIDWFDRDTLEMETPYDADFDRTFYHRPDRPGLRVNNFPGYFTVLFPGDAHMPKLQIPGEANLVKKVVAKVHVDLLRPE